MRVRKACKSEEKELLKGIFEMDETYVKNAPQDRDEDDNDKKGGGHSNKTHTSVVAFKEKDSNLKTFGHSSKENCKKLPFCNKEIS